MMNKLIDLLFKKIFYLKLKKRVGKYMFTMNDEMVKNAVFMIIAGLWTIDDVMDFDNFKDMVIARLTFKKEEAKQKAEELNKPKPVEEVVEEPVEEPVEEVVEEVVEPVEEPVEAVTLPAKL